MEWLMIIAFIVVSIMDSKKKSDQAKQQREQRQRMQGQQVYRTESTTMSRQQEKSAAARQRTAPQKRTAQKGGNLFDSLNDWMESLEEMLGPDEESMQLPGTQKKAAAKPKRKKTAPQQAKKSPGTLPTKTLMEMRPEREKRGEHTKVTASVKPLKNAFENQDSCEHRIELNPNIQYSKQKQNADAKAAAIVKTDRDSLVQGIIWSEILGKPKAYQPNEPKFRRR